MSKPVYIVGHKNPDTDSICSAIAYARLKQLQGVDAVPVRAGKINQETQFVLDYFGVKEPKYLDDLYPRVKDIMLEDYKVVQSNSNLKELGQIMRKYKIQSVPVVSKDSELLGIISVSDLAHRYFDELEMQDLRDTGVDYHALLKVLEGKLICGHNLERKVTGRVKIAAAKTNTLKYRLGPGEVVLARDREQAHLVAINVGVACLIVTGNSHIEEKVIEEAVAHDIIIIRSPYDTYTSARLINQSIPVDYIMQKNVLAFKPTDLVADIKTMIVSSNFRNYPVIENGKLKGLINRNKLIVPNKQRVILVDHNESTQAVEGIEEAHILEIIDHHRLGGLQTNEPIFIRHEPVGCTATIITNMYRQLNFKIDNQIAGLLLSAIISDTILFKSPTSTEIDKETAEYLAYLIGIDLYEYGLTLLKSGVDLTNTSPAKIMHNDLKEFDIDNINIAVGQISIMEPQAILDKKEEILEYMELLQAKNRYHMVLLVITDIINEASYLLFTNDAYELVQKAYKTESSKNQIYLPHVMSRKKQIIPPLIEARRRK